MEIIINEDNEDKITLTDEGLDNDNFVVLRIGKKEIDVFIDDLMSALKAFEEQRDRNYLYNKRCSD